MEQKAAHTPAPWLIEWNAAQGGEGHYITDSKDMVELSRIAAVLFHDDADGETRANARLIAASPTMYDYLVERAQSGDARAASIVEDINAVRTAIAKATRRDSND